MLIFANMLHYAGLPIAIMFKKQWNRNTENTPVTICTTCRNIRQVCTRWSYVPSGSHNKKDRIPAQGHLVGLCNADSLFRELDTELLYISFHLIPDFKGRSTALSSRRPGFDFRTVHVGLAVDEVASGHVYLRAPLFPLVYRSTNVIHTSSS
jgi:hypothetical protein